MTEAQFIQREQGKLDRRLVGQLKKIRSTGFAGKRVIETLLVNRLIEFTRPSDRIAYNHYRLTPEGLALLERLVKA